MIPMEGNQFKRHKMDTSTLPPSVSAQQQSYFETQSPTSSQILSSTSQSLSISSQRLDLSLIINEQQLPYDSSMSLDSFGILKKFAHSLDTFKIHECLICEESGINPRGQYQDITFICYRCIRERDSSQWAGIYTYSQSNDMSPGIIQPR